MGWWAALAYLQPCKGNRWQAQSIYATVTSSVVSKHVETSAVLAPLDASICAMQKDGIHWRSKSLVTYSWIPHFVSLGFWTQMHHNFVSLQYPIQQIIVFILPPRQRFYICSVSTIPHPLPSSTNLGIASLWPTDHMCAHSCMCHATAYGCNNRWTAPRILELDSGCYFGSRNIGMVRYQLWMTSSWTSFVSLLFPFHSQLCVCSYCSSQRMMNYLDNLSFYEVNFSASLLKNPFQMNQLLCSWLADEAANVSEFPTCLWTPDAGKGCFCSAFDWEFWNWMLPYTSYQLDRRFLAIWQIIFFFVRTKKDGLCISSRQSEYCAANFVFGYVCHEDLDFGVSKDEAKHPSAVGQTLTRHRNAPAFRRLHFSSASHRRPGPNERPICK